MPRKARRRRSSARLGSTGLLSHGEKVCVTHFKGNQQKIDACKQTVRGMVKKMVREKGSICRKWCGCG